MSDIKLFQFQGFDVTELTCSAVKIEKSLQEKTLKYYLAYKRVKNFACVKVYTQSNKLQVYTKLNPDELQLEDSFTSDVRNIGDFGTGDLEITIRSEEDLAKAEPLILKSYEGS